MIDRFGPRLTTVCGCCLSTFGLLLSFSATSIHFLYISFGVITGLGWSLACLPLMSVIANCFRKFRKISTGACVSGVGMGFFVYPPLLTFLIAQFHWRGALLILAGINLNLLVCAAAMIPPRLSARENVERQLLEEEHARRQSLKNAPCDSVLSMEKSLRCWRERLLRTFSFDLLKNPHFLLFGLNNIFFSFCVSIVFTHLSNLAKHRHFQPLFCSGLISAMGAANTVSRIGLGVVIQHPRVNAIAVYIVAYLLAGLVTLPITFVSSYPAMMAYAVVFGMFSAAYGTVTPEVVVCICGLRRLAIGYGYIQVFEAIGMLTGGPTAGWVLEASTEYHGCFIMAGCASMVAAAVMIPSWWTLARNRAFADARLESIDETVKV